MHRSLYIFLFVSGILLGQETENKYKIIESTISNIQTKQTKHDAHIQKLVEQLKKQDSIIEEQVKNIVESISSYQDSGKSKTKIIRYKESIIAGLKKSIDFYADERKKMNQELVYAKRFPTEDIQKIKNWLDEKIEIRVKQIIKIVNSLETYKDSKSYYQTENNARNNKNAERADKNRERLIDKMNSGKVSLQKRILKIEKELENVNTKIPMADLANELTALYKKIDLLNDSMVDADYEVNNNSPKLNKKDAAGLERELRAKVRNVKSEFQSFTRGLASTIRLLAARKAFNTQIDELEVKLKILKGQ